MAVIASVLGLSSCLKSEDPNAGFNEEVKQIESYLVANPTSDYILRDYSSGSVFVIHQFGDSLKAVSGNTVTVNYEGKSLVSGNIFTPRKEVKGLKEALSPSIISGLSGIFLAGTNGTLYIPSKSNSDAAAPAGSPAVYDFKIEKVVKSAAALEQFKIDTAKFKTYFADSIQAITHSTGVRYRIEKEGTGDYATPFSNITIKYTMKTLPTGAIVDQNASSPATINGFIEGLTIGMQLMREGSTFTFFIPSGLGYGPSGKGSIAGNTNLRFEVTLTKIDQR